MMIRGGRFTSSGRLVVGGHNQVVLIGLLYYYAHFTLKAESHPTAT